jgi:hypothetical protein
MSWINLSDQLTKKKQLPSAALFRIYPVSGSVDDRDPIDFSYTVTWEEGKQYWYDIVLDEGRNLKGHAKQITMVDYAGHAEPFVVPINATDRRIAELWEGMIDPPQCYSRNKRRNRLNLSLGN